MTRPRVCVARGVHVGTYRDDLPELARDCLRRDGYKCILTGWHHEPEVLEWIAAQNVGPDEPPRDDDGEPVDEGMSQLLEIVYIIPRSVMLEPSRASSQESSQVSGSGKATSHAGTDRSATKPMIDQLSESRRTTIAMLQIFSSNILAIINGTLIDHPRNAIALSILGHQKFGRFGIWFEPCPGPDGDDNTYAVLASERMNIKWLKGVIRLRNLPEDRVISRDNEFGFKVTFRSTPDCPAPDRELLRVHAAIARVLHLSAAGYAGDDLEDVWVRADGSVDFGPPDSARVQTWLEGVIA